jgi:hypothetical protein
MLCLFADLSPFVAALPPNVRLPPQAPVSPKMNPIARPDLCLLSAPIVDLLHFRYRDGRSNPLATVLPQRCQPLVTRIVCGLEL